MQDANRVRIEENTRGRGERSDKHFLLLCIFSHTNTFLCFLRGTFIVTSWGRWAELFSSVCMWDTRGRERRGWWFVEDRVSSLSFPHYNWSFFSRKIKHSFYLENFQDRLFTSYGNLFLHATYIFMETDFWKHSRKEKTWWSPCRIASCYYNKRMNDQKHSKGQGMLGRDNSSKTKNTKHQLCIRERCSVNNHSRCSFVYTHKKISLPTICVQPWKHSLISQKESALIILQIRNSLGNVVHSSYLIKTAQEGFIDPDFGKTSLHIPCYLV